MSPTKPGLRFTALSDVGRVRRDNQDSGYAGPHLLAIADGVGGAARGDIASSAAIQELRRLDQAPGNDALEQLAGAVHLAHNRLADLVEENPDLDGTSTTTTAALFDGSRLSVAHVGDSRAYLLRTGELRQLTKDHTFVQSLVDEGRITDEEARVHPHRNLILRAVDAVHEPDPDAFTLELEAGDRLLFCSDGCSGVLTDDELASLLATDPLDRSAPALVNAALEAGSSDNVTVIVAEVVNLEEDGDPPAPVVVGAASGDARMPLRGGLRRRRHEPEAPVDPEAMRYAPLPPRRAWPRRVALLVLVLVLVAAAAAAGYRYTQEQYYVAADGAYVAVYQGVSADLGVGGLRLHHVKSRSALRLADLSDADRSNVVDGVPQTGLDAALAKVKSLERKVCAAHAEKVKEQQRKARNTRHKPGKKKSGTKSGTRSGAKSGAGTLSRTYPDCLGRS